MKTTTQHIRRSCPAHMKRHLLDVQDGVCIYCLVPFGSVVRLRSRLRLTVVHFDHVIPLALCQTNRDENWVAACNICNQLKSSLVFETVHEARVYIMDRWASRGWYVDWVTPVSSEVDPERWAIKFGTYLAGLPRNLAGALQWKRPYMARKVHERERKDGAA